MLLSLYITLFLLGLFMVCLEIFIPGGIVGTAGAASILVSFWLAYSRLGPETGSYFIMAGLVLLMAGISVSMIVFPKTRFSNRIFLSADQRGYASGAGEKSRKIEGAEGVAVTRLRPSGVARIGGKRYSVITAGDFIESGEKIRVVKIEGNRVTVKAIGGEQERS